MGRKKTKTRVSKFKYYSVIVSRIIEMFFVFTMFIVVPCIFPSATYEELTDAVITIDKIQHISGTRTSRSCYMITSTDGVKYFVYSIEGRRAITKKEIKVGDVCSIKYMYWFFENNVKELKIGDKEYISYGEGNSTVYTVIIIGILYCLLLYGALVIWRKITYYKKDKPKRIKTNKDKPRKKSKWKKGRKGKDKRK